MNGIFCVNESVFNFSYTLCSDILLIFRKFHITLVFIHHKVSFSVYLYEMKYIIINFNAADFNAHLLCCWLSSNSISFPRTMNRNSQFSWIKFNCFSWKEEKDNIYCCCSFNFLLSFWSFTFETLRCTRQCICSDIYSSVCEHLEVNNGSRPAQYATSNTYKKTKLFTPLLSTANCNRNRNFPSTVFGRALLFARNILTQYGRSVKNEYIFSIKPNTAHNLCK